MSVSSNATAVRRSESPGLTVTAGGDTITSLTRRLTVTAAYPVTPEDVALTSAPPLTTPVTSPDPSTVATEVSLDAQTNSAPATGYPFASLATASSRSVSPSSNF